MAYSWLLLFVLFFVLISTDICSVAGHPGLNIGINLGPSPNKKPDSTITHKTVLNAPLGLGSLTLSHSHVDKTKPKPTTEKNSSSETCEESAEKGPCSKSTEVIEPGPSKKPAAGKWPQHHDHHHHHHKHGGHCGHPKPGKPTPSKGGSTPSGVPTPAPNTGNTGSSTEDVNVLIGDVFNGGTTSTTNSQNIDPNDPEQTGAGNIDVRIKDTTEKTKA